MSERDTKPTTPAAPQVTGESNMPDAPPVVKALRVSKGAIRTVSVRCPYCRRIHVHGWPREFGSPNPGNRLSHCRTPDKWGSYDIVVVEK